MWLRFIDSQFSVTFDFHRSVVRLSLVENGQNMTYTRLSQYTTRYQAKSDVRIENLRKPTYPTTSNLLNDKYDGSTERESKWKKTKPRQIKSHTSLRTPASGRLPKRHDSVTIKRILTGHGRSAWYYGISKITRSVTWIAVRLPRNQRSFDSRVSMDQYTEIRKKWYCVLKN